MERILLTGIGALFSAAVGAWLHSMLVARRERWNLRRELYSKLLECLSDAREALQSLLVVEIADPRHTGGSSNPDVLARLDAKKKELGVEFTQAIQSVRRASSVAEILLGKTSVRLLDQLKMEQQTSTPTISYFPSFNKQLRLIIRTQKMVASTARRELGVRNRFAEMLSFLECRCGQGDTDDLNWMNIAKERWGGAIEWIRGDGPFALVAPCRALTVTLWQTEEQAERERVTINRAGCGGQCNWSLHAVIDLREE